MSKTRGVASHIQCLEANQAGKDRVIGDVHGNSHTLRDVVSYMNHRDDRLFIAGDLTDRGEHSLSVIEGIIKYNKDYGKPGRVYCIRGNHEDMCLKTIRALERINQRFALRISDSRLEELRVKHQKPDLNKQGAVYLDLLEKGEELANDDFLDDLDTIEYHCDPGNGGEWLVALYLHEVQCGYIALDDGEIVYHPQSRVNMVKKFISDLPYIIHVQGDQPFNVVHADMPFNDKTLLRRIRKKQGLSDREIKHATWMRMSSSKYAKRVEKAGRCRDSIPTLVGHSIVCEENIDECVRENTHTFNLDVESYYLGVAVIVNMTEVKCEVSKEVSDDHHIFTIMLRLNKALKAMAQKESSRRLKNGKENEATLYASKSKQENRLVKDSSNELRQSGKSKS